MALSTARCFRLFNVLFQGTIAILLLVGFESATAFGAESRNARRDVPRAVLIALVIQCLLAYLFEYFAANYTLANTTVVLPDGVAAATASVDDVIAGATASQAPIGDMVVAVGNAMLGGAGFVIINFLGWRPPALVGGGKPTAAKPTERCILERTCYTLVVLPRHPLGKRFRGAAPCQLNLRGVAQRKPSVRKRFKVVSRGPTSDFAADSSNGTGRAAVNQPYAADVVSLCRNI